MINENKQNINESDLNLIDFLNGSGKLNYKGIAPNTKGAGSEYLGGQGSGEDIFSEIINNRLLFINQQKNLFMSMLIEKWDYQNLPWDKYYFESTLLEKGSVAIFKLSDELVALDYTIDEINYFSEPEKIKVKNKDVELILNKEDFVIVRSNLSCESVFLKGIRYFSLMETILYYINDNLHAAKERGVFVKRGGNFSTGNNNDLENNMNNLVKAPETFLVYQGSDLSAQNLLERDGQLFLPIELRDRTEQLITTYNNIFERVKELFGVSSNPQFGKKERLIQDEIDNQDEIGNLNLNHFVNIRKNDFKKVNELFGTNISIDLIQEEKLLGGSDEDIQYTDEESKLAEE